MQVFFKDVTQSYDGKILFDHLNLEIPAGGLFTLLGPSGCGKTTLLRMLAGFIRPDSGKIFFGDRDVTRVPVHKRNTGIVFQDYALFPDRSVLENVLYGLRARHVPTAKAKAEALEMLSQVGLKEYASRMPSELSGGQKQRVAMARALVIKPQLLLLDEPLSALDVKLRVELRRLIRDLQVKSGITTLFVTHDQSEALAMSDYVAVLRHGKILQIGTPGEIYGAPSCRFVSDFLGRDSIPVVEEAGSAQDGSRIIRLEDGLALTADTRPITKGLYLSVRPNEIRLKKASGEPAPGEIPATVHQIEYCGAVNVYIIETGHRSLLAEVPSELPLFPAGSKVFAVLPKTGKIIGEEP